MRRYRSSRSWPVGGLALIAAAGAVLATGTLSSSLNGGPDPAFAAGIGRSVAGVGTAREGRAASPASRAPAAPAAFSPAPPPAGVWQIQVGAFLSTASAESQLRALETEVPELTRLAASHQLRGRITRVRIGGIEDEASARALCTRILEVGRGCFVAGPET